MSTPVNYYIGIARGNDQINVDQLTVGTATAGASVDIEVRIQINNGTALTNVNDKDAVNALEMIRQFILEGNPFSAGANLPGPAP